MRDEKCKQKGFVCFGALYGHPECRHGRCCDALLRGGGAIKYAVGDVPLLKKNNPIDELESRNLALNQSKTTPTGCFPELLAGFHYVVPKTCLVIGPEVGFTFPGISGKRKINAPLQLSASSPYIDPNFPPMTKRTYGSYTQTYTLKDQWSAHVGGVIGAKMGARFLPYVKLGVSLHSLKLQTSSDFGEFNTFNVDPVSPLDFPASPGQITAASVKKTKTRALFAMTFGCDVNVTDRVLMGVAYGYKVGSLGFFSKAQTKEYAGLKRLNRIQMHELMVTCKYSIPVKKAR